MLAIRWSVELGAARNTRSRPYSSEASSQRARLLGRQVGGDQPRAAGRGQVAGERAHAVLVDRVPVGHDQHRDAGRGHRLDGAQHVGDLGARGQRAVHGLGDDRAVHQRVGVGQADLDDVGAGRGHGPGRLDGAVHGGEPGGQVADQGGAAVRVRPSRSVTATDGHSAEPLRRGVHVLVAAAGQVDQDQAVRAEFAADLQRAGQRVRRLDGRDDALGPAQHREGVHGLRRR